MSLEVEREGLGYRAWLADEGVGLAIDRMVESRGELTGELSVARAPEGRLLSAARFNVTSLTARTTLAKVLEGRSHMGREGGPSWSDVLEDFALGVLGLHRAGEPVVTLGGLPARGAPEYVLEPFILGGNAATILYGFGGTGKSTLAALAAVAVASGKSTLAGWTVPRPRPVLVLDWEADAGDWNDIVVGASKGLGIEPPQVLYRPSSGSLPAQVHEVAKMVTQREVGLLIVDSVGLAMPGVREGSSAEEGALRFFGALRTIGIPALLIDHKRKNNGDGDDDGPYGSVYKRNSARLAWELRSASEREEGDDLHLALICRKTNKTALLRPVGLRIERADGAIRAAREDIAPDPSLDRALSLSERIARVLGHSKPMTLRDIADAVGTGPATIAVTISRSERYVKVGRDGKADLWALAARDPGGPATSNNSNKQSLTVRGQAPTLTSLTKSPPLIGGGGGTVGDGAWSDGAVKTNVRVRDEPEDDDSGSFDALVRANEWRHQPDA